MAAEPKLEATWRTFREQLAAVASGPVDAASAVRGPASEETLAACERHLGRALPEALRALYALADGFEPGAFLLRDDYRILPLGEALAASLTLVGEPVTEDWLAGTTRVAKEVKRWVFAEARPDDPDVERISVRLSRRATVEVWFREGGIHDFAEVVHTSDTLGAWLADCLTYYG